MITHKIFLFALGVCALLNPHTVFADEVKVPSQINFPRFQLLEKPSRLNSTSKLKVYISIAGRTTGVQRNNETLLTSHNLLNRYEIQNFRKELTNRIQETGRFEVFDQSMTDVLTESSVIVEGQVLSVTQHFENIMVAKKARTRIRLSIQIKDTETGQIFRSKTFTGEFGDKEGEGTVMAVSANVDTKEVQESLYNDLKRALERAVEEAAYHIESQYRPVGRVTQVAGQVFAMDGGSLHGFKGDEEVVVFRTRFIDQNGIRVPGIITGVAVARCPTVQDYNSPNCRVGKNSDAGGVQVGDYVVLADSGLLRKQH